MRRSQRLPRTPPARSTPQVEKAALAQCRLAPRLLRSGERLLVLIGKFCIRECLARVRIVAEYVRLNVVVGGLKAHNSGGHRRVQSVMGSFERDRWQSEATCVDMPKRSSRYACCTGMGKGHKGQARATDPNIHTRRPPVKAEDWDLPLAGVGERCAVRPKALDGRRVAKVQEELNGQVREVRGYCVEVREEPEPGRVTEVLKDWPGGD